jgi:hypothetical protein
MGHNGETQRPWKLSRSHVVVMAVLGLGLLGCLEYTLMQSHHAKTTVLETRNQQQGLLRVPIDGQRTTLVHADSATAINNKVPNRANVSSMASSSSTLQHHLAIVIPFRDSLDPRSQGIHREKNLQEWLDYMSNYLRPELCAVTTVYVVEQSQEGIFNKGVLFNAGFDYIMKTNPTIDYLIFHDVDQVPRDAKCSNCYDYRSSPTKLIRETTRVENGKQIRRKLSPSNVGGALMITPEIYRKVNGYSNVLAGWGIEDDNMAYRIKRFHGGFRVLTPGTFRGLAHPRVPGLDTTDQFQENAKNRQEIESGLSNVKYELSGETKAQVKNLSVVRVVVHPL